MTSEAAESPFPAAPNSTASIPMATPRKSGATRTTSSTALRFDAAGSPCSAPETRACIYRIDSDALYTALVNAAPTQVTALLAGRDGKLYAATGNVGKVYEIGPGLEPEGSIETDVFDAGMFSQWGRLSFKGIGSTAAGSPSKRAAAISTGRRKTGAHGRTPSLPKRRTRDVSGGAVHPVEGDAHDGCETRAARRNSIRSRWRICREMWRRASRRDRDHAAELQVPGAVERRSSTPPVSESAAARQSGEPHGKRAQPGQHLNPCFAVFQGRHRRALGRRSDDNGDSLIYTVEIRGARETEWKLLKDKVREKYISWDSTAFPDGEYRLRVTASDLPSNTQGRRAHRRNSKASVHYRQHAAADHQA